MKILLFNDNPVVRKLVALSAQKTKDELSVIWSVDEVEESSYDLLIIDDALYSDETFESLKELITFKSTLLMATRGQAIPSGFNHVINKPFLPTDLVDMFIQIDKKTSSNSAVKEESPIQTPEIEEQEPVFNINLDEELTDLSNSVDHLDDLDLSDLEDEIDLGDHESAMEIDDVETLVEGDEPAILDKEEVQEVQNLLDDTESDDWDFDHEEMTAESMEEQPSLSEDAESFDDLLEGFDDPMEGLESLKETEIGAEEDPFDLDELLASGGVDEEEDEDEPTLLLDQEEDEHEEELVLPELEDEDLLLDDEALEDLESKIEDAMSHLEAESLDKELDFGDVELDFEDEMMEEIPLAKEGLEMANLEGLDEFDTLDERELKRAIGEEVDEDEEMSDDEGFDFELPEESAEEEPTENADVPSNVPTINPSNAEGIEALQSLLKALSNEEVAKSLKGLNISININIGNDA